LKPYWQAFVSEIFEFSVADAQKQIPTSQRRLRCRWRTPASYCAGRESAAMREQRRRSTRKWHRVAQHGDRIIRFAGSER